MKFIPCDTGAKRTISLGVVGSVAGTVVIHMGGNLIKAGLRSEAEQYQLMGMSAFQVGGRLE